jgi:hypothetical protein
MKTIIRSEEHLTFSFGRDMTKKNMTHKYLLYEKNIDISRERKNGHIAQLIEKQKIILCFIFDHLLLLMLLVLQA